MENNDNNFGFFDSQESEHFHQQNLEPMNHPEQSSEHSGKKGRKGMRAAVSAVLVMALVAGSCGATYGVVNSRWEQQAQADAAAIEQLQQRLNNRQSTQADPVSYVMEEGAMSPKQIYQEYASSVVAISSTIETLSYGGQSRQGTSTGSGFILTDDGYVVTNYHVIEGASAVTVVMDNQEEYQAEVIGHDSLNDVAVLKIDAKNLPAVKLGSSDALSIGDMVVAIGNPLGSLTATLTVGYVSGKDRQVSTDSTVINMIQTDAAINSGNSGGPLFNLYGEVVGITNAKFSSSSSGASIDNIGFAIPINQVKNLVSSIIVNGYVVKPYLGVSVTTVSAEAQSYGIPQGAAVKQINEDSPAEEAGLKENDIITHVDGDEITSSSNLVNKIASYAPGTKVTLSVYRQGEPQELVIHVTLGEQKQEPQQQASQQQSQSQQSQSQQSQQNQQSGINPFDMFPFGYGYGYSNGGGSGSF